MVAIKSLFTVASVLAVAGFVNAAPAPLEKRITHTGKATYFAVGLGACGWTNTDSDFIVALNQAQYEANNGANCGQGLKITNPATGKTAIAAVADMCPGCSDGSLDMSPSLFSYLSDGNMDEGVFQMSWNFLKKN
jgi:expansin (peptidoglycan-binding protein)